MTYKNTYMCVIYVVRKGEKKKERNKNVIIENNYFHL